jgi:hypothetical protein
MPLLSDEIVKEKLDNPLNIAIEPLSETDVEQKIVPIYRGGRPDGQIPIPDEMNILTGSLTRLDSGSKVASNFGMSKRHAQDLANGEKTQGIINHDLLKAVEERTGSVSNLALDLLTQSLLNAKDNLPSLAQMKFRDQVNIAKDLSGIVGNLRPKESHSGASANIILFAPNQKNMDDLFARGPVIEVSSNQR